MNYCLRAVVLISPLHFVLLRSQIAAQKLEAILNRCCSIIVYGRAFSHRLCTSYCCDLKSPLKKYEAISNRLRPIICYGRAFSHSFLHFYRPAITHRHMTYRFIHYKRRYHIARSVRAIFKITVFKMQAIPYRQIRTGDFT